MSSRISKTKKSRPPATAERSAPRRLFSPPYHDLGIVADLRVEFAQHSYVKLPGLLTSEAHEWLLSRIAALRGKAIRRDFLMPGFESLRCLRVIGGSSIARADPLLALIYTHPEVLHLVRSLVGERFYPSEQEDEFMVINLLHKPHDTHGWHLDDPAYALVLIFEAPPAEAGGNLEYIPDWPALCTTQGASPNGSVSACVEWSRQLGLVQLRHHAAGDGYLLKASTVLHRVTPIVHAKAGRVVLNAAYQEVQHQNYGPTASMLYSLASDKPTNGQPATESNQHEDLTTMRHKDNRMSGLRNPRQLISLSKGKLNTHQ